VSDKIVNRVLALVLVVCMFTIGGYTLAANARRLAYAALVSYVQYTDSDANFFEGIRARINSFTTSFNNALLGKSLFQKFNAQMQLSIGKQMLSFGDKTMVRLKTGQLYDLMDDCDVTSELNKMEKMHAYLAERDIPFLFVYAHTMLYEDDLLPFGAEDYNIKVADDIVSGLRARGIDTIDSRDVVKEASLPLEKAVFHTDAHWNIYAAFSVYQKTCAWLRESAGIPVPEEASDESRFDIEVHPRRFMGSVGERVGDGYVTPDDFPIITPKFDTNIKSNLLTADGYVETTGPFRDSVLNMNELFEDGNKYANCYDVYGYHNEVVYYTNDAVPSGRILVIKDSFGTPVSSFLALAAHEICAIDLRKGRISAEEFIGSFAPDAVIIVHCQEMLRGRNYAFVD
jgi:hypothetical protein